MYDYLIVGAGMFGSVFAYLANKANKKVLVIDQRNHVGGNCYTENVDGINVHKYGAHIFHTDNQEVWEFINQFGEFKPFINQPIAIINNQSYNLPFNMNTFSRVFGVTKPEEIIDIIDKETSEYKDVEPQNLEEQALKFVGKTIYEMFIKEYTEKQWGKKCTELPKEIIKRIPIRLTYDNNYFNDKYQAIPIGGYTSLFNNMLNNIEVKLNTTENSIRNTNLKFNTIIYTGMIDEYFDYSLGELEYRSLKFVEVEKETENYQGNAVCNYPSKNIGYIRSIEHKHFLNDQSAKTIISYEFSVKYKRGMIPFYPIQTDKNIKLYDKYCELAKEYKNIYFSGRLGNFKYFDMDDTIENAMSLAKQLL